MLDVFGGVDEGPGSRVFVEDAVQECHHFLLLRHITGADSRAHRIRGAHWSDGCGSGGGGADNLGIPASQDLFAIAVGVVGVEGWCPESENDVDGNLGAIGGHIHHGTTVACGDEYPCMTLAAAEKTW